MSIEAIAWAASLTLPPRDKFVLVALCDHYNRDERSAWMKQGTLARWTGYNRETIVKALHALEHEHGLIASEQRRYPDGRHASKVYRLPGLEHRVGQTDTATPTRVGHTDTDRVHQTDTDRVGQTDNKNLELRTVNTEPRPTPPTPPRSRATADLTTSSATPTRATADQLLETWNQNRGALPAAWKVTSTRRKALTRFAHEHGPQAVEILAAAARAVAANDFWIQRQYGLDNLLAGDKVTRYAEQHANAHGLSPADRKLATTAAQIANAIGGLP